MIPPFDERPAWLKGRGYLHITPKIDILKKYEEIFTKVKDEVFVGRHGFFPLIHSVIKERKFKKLPKGKPRGHSYKEKGKYKKTAKLRPLHYATHIDSMIFGYYAELLLNLYEEELEKYAGLPDCVTAYRKIGIDEFDDSEEPSEDGEEQKELVGKSTIHFAHEAFEEIKKRATDGCVVLMFDIKSFFSELNHDKLKEAWCGLLKVSRLNADHFNVFKAATEFRYILKNDLRIKQGTRGRRSSFNERKLASIRKNQGIEAFFESVEDFRNAIKNRELTVFKHPFMKNNVPVGIPQGLPISAVLANLYLLEFDKEVLKTVVDGFGGFYRRYSDDIMVICKPEQADDTEKFILDEIIKSHVKISTEKTEKYLFKYFQISPRKNKLTSILLSKNSSAIGKPLTYLGFEFYGEKTLIKSSNLAKFYRRMISTVKKKANRAINISKHTSSGPAIFRGGLKRTYSILKLETEQQFTKRKKLVRNSYGQYSMEFEEVKRRSGTNYFSYAKRASVIMNEPAIKNQIRNHKRIFNSAITRHLKKGLL